MLKLIKKINRFWLNMFTQNENVGLVTLDTTKLNVKMNVENKERDSVIYNIFK